MQIDTRIFFGRYIVASYGRGAVSVKDSETDRSISHAGTLPTTPGGFAALFS